MLPTAHSQELPGIYAQEKPGATRSLEVIPRAVADSELIPLEDLRTYDFNDLSSHNSANCGTDLPEQVIVFEDESAYLPP